MVTNDLEELKTGVGRAARQFKSLGGCRNSSSQIRPSYYIVYLFRLQVRAPDALLDVSAGTGCFLFLENRLSAGRWRLP